MDNIPSDPSAGTKWIADRITKMLNERRWTADKIRDIRRDAANDGFPASTIAAAVRFRRMGPERLTKYVAEVSEALSLYGYGGIPVAREDARNNRVTVLRAHVEKIIYLEAEKKEYGAEIRDLYKAAKDRGINVAALRDLMRLSRLDPDDREERLHAVDALASTIGYW